MSVTALPSAAPPRLLHPLWCEETPPQRDDAPHRGRQTCWEVGDVRFTMCRIRWDDPRYVNGQGEDVNESGGPAPERGNERVELTMTDTAGLNLDGSPITVSTDFSVATLRMTIALQQQQLEELEADLSREWMLTSDWPREERAASA